MTYINYNDFAQFIENRKKFYGVKREEALFLSLSLGSLKRILSDYEREKEEEVGETDIVEALGFVVAPR